MKIFKSYKTELKPTKEQIVLLNKSVGVARFAYNWGLNKRKELWESLADLIYICDCGLEIDRDLNAAINLEKLGIQKINNTGGHSEIQACGESVRLLNLKDSKATSMKQECMGSL